MSYNKWNKYKRLTSQPRRKWSPIPSNSVLTPAPPRTYTGEEAKAIILKLFPLGIEEGTHNSKWQHQSISDQVVGYCSCGEWFCSVSDWYRTPEETVATFNNEHRIHLLTMGVSV